jgi:hypothetical protein
MEITETEFVTLVKMSGLDDTKFVSCEYGKGWVRLREVASNTWAFDAIKAMRANVK